MLDDYKKVRGIRQVQELGLPTPKTIIVSNFSDQINEVNNFLLTRDYVMVRSDSKDKSMNCPSLLKCNPMQAKDFIKNLNSNGYTAILQDFVPLNNKYSGNILLLNNSIIVELMRGGPGSKLTREGLLHEHIRLSNEGVIIFHQGERVIPPNELEYVINLVKNLPKHHIVSFSAGPDWLYFWDAQEDPSSKKLD